MSQTIVEFTAYQGETLVGYLTARAGAVGTPAASYAAAETDEGLYRLTVPEALVGKFNLKVLDPAGDLAFRGHVDLIDDALVHVAYEPGAEAQLSDELAKVIKTGEAFITTSEYEEPRVVTFTRE